MNEIREEWLVQYANGVLHNEDSPFSSEGDARRELTRLRKTLDAYGVPEEHWPILVKREIQTVVTVGSWQVSNV